ncbi:hypothetical protein KDA_25240 [Dictyobacter alpinus]|uniref:Uncharacterized protein n=1 Tax=Dictyobacter alpinus TaxID=2014873 RepID=A0A402B6V1_9CHLR|nr:hypothetical protein [Dictyobacter alpinus]GCE27040.1 hypothetical protein KDA_25240 [Dictyobacter alpinus]
MGDQWDQDPNINNNNTNNNTSRPSQDEIDRQLKELRRVVTQGANEAQVRIKRVVDKAGDYWQQVQAPPASPNQPSNVEEQRLRQLINAWSNENWRVARDLGTYMDILSTRVDEVWEISLETRWETRAMEIISEPYTGRTANRPRPLLPVWDYELPEVTGLKAPTTRTRLDEMNEVVSCTSCNSTGHVLCSGCNGRGWIVCPECKGRTKKRCTTCRGRGYVSDWTPGEKKPFFKKQADNVASSVTNKFSDVFDNIRQQGVPIPNPVDTDPASKGPTVPCPDCVNGEVNCSCGNGKRVCTTCQGAKMSLCSNCAGTGKVVRHREINRRFDLRSQTRFIGDTVIPAQYLTKAEGDLVYSAEINETLHMDAPPDLVPTDVWRATVELVESERKTVDKPGLDPQSFPRPTLQVAELVRIPYTTVRYRFSDQEYVLYIYDTEGNEKFYSDRFPARWDRVERLVKAITTDLRAPVQLDQREQSNASQQPNSYSGGYRVPIEVPPYNVTEEEDDQTDPRPPTSR